MITYSIRIFIAITVATAYAEGVGLIAIAVAVSFGNVRASTVVDLPWPIADAAGVQRPHAVVGIVTDAIAVGISGASASAVAQDVNRQTGPVIVCGCRVEVAGVAVGASAGFCVIADAIAIGIGGA